MKNRFKYFIIVSFLLLLTFVIVNIFLDARDKKLEQERLEKDKIAKTTEYQVKRENNKYKVVSDKLEGKELNNIYYDSYNVYLYYTDESSATLLKYNVEDNKVVVLFENSNEILGGMSHFNKYFKLGNAIYNTKFEKISDYPSLSNGEYLFPNLNKILFTKEDGVYIKKIKTGEEELVIKNEENITYSAYSVKDDGKFYLVKKHDEDNDYILVFNKENKIINTFNANSEENTTINYLLLDDVPYLLKTSKSNELISYKITNVNDKQETYKSSDEYKNYIFDNTKFICNDSDGNIRLIDYTTNENKILIKNDENKEKIVKYFVMAKDLYSLVISLDGSNKEFYIFYL